MNRLVGAALLALCAACGDTINEGDTIIAVAPLPVPERGHIVALTTTGILFWVDPADPAVILGGGALAGLGAGDTLRSIAYRPANLELYGYSLQGMLWRIDWTSRLATQVGASPTPFGEPPFGNALVVATSFSHNEDVMRLIATPFVGLRSDNARINPLTGWYVADTPLPLYYSLYAIAYKVEASGATTLYGIGGPYDNLVRVGGVGGTPSANLGLYTDIGPLGLPHPYFVHMGLTITNAGQAYAAVASGTGFVTRLYTVNLETGTATLIGTLGSGGPVRAIAVVP